MVTTTVPVKINFSVRFSLADGHSFFLSLSFDRLSFNQIIIIIILCRSLKEQKYAHLSGNKKNPKRVCFSFFYQRKKIISSLCIWLVFKAD